MSFERFEVPKLVRVAGDNIAIGKQGHLNITFNFRKYFKGYPACELYFDKSENKIGVKPVKEATHLTRKIGMWGGEGRTPVVVIASFLKFYNIAYQKKITYPARWDESQKMLVIDLNGGS